MVEGMAYLIHAGGEGFATVVIVGGRRVTWPRPILSCLPNRVIEKIGEGQRSGQSFTSLPRPWSCTIRLLKRHRKNKDSTMKRTRHDIHHCTVSRLTLSYDNPPFSIHRDRSVQPSGTECSRQVDCQTRTHMWTLFEASHLQKHRSRVVHLTGPGRDIQTKTILVPRSRTMG